jgi:hypothetical protein
LRFLICTYLAPYIKRKTEEGSYASEHQKKNDKDNKA